MAPEVGHGNNVVNFAHLCRSTADLTSAHEDSQTWIHWLRLRDRDGVIREREHGSDTDAESKPIPKREPFAEPRLHCDELCKHVDQRWRWPFQSELP